MLKKLSSLIIMGTVLASCNFSEGERSGSVVKFSKKGFIFKTYEGELATLARGAQATMLANTFTFSVTDDSMVKKNHRSYATG